MDGTELVAVTECRALIHPPLHANYGDIWEIGRVPVWVIRVGQKWPNPLISHRIVKKKFKVEKNQDAVGVGVLFGDREDVRTLAASGGEDGNAGAGEAEAWGLLCYVLNLVELSDS